MWTIFQWATHLPLARQCLLADRDVVIDKPFALSSSEAAELIQLARSRGRLLSVYQNRRWDGDFLTVRKLLDGDLGIDARRIAAGWKGGTASFAMRRSAFPSERSKVRNVRKFMTERPDEKRAVPPVGKT